MQLGDVLKKWRKMSDLPLRAAAVRIGVSVATLSRIENGESMDGFTLAVILIWLLGATKAKPAKRKKRLRPGAFTSDEPGIGVGWGT